MSVVLIEQGPTDRQATRVMLPRLRAQFRKIVLVWADGGYRGCIVTRGEGETPARTGDRET
ncbi:hypothetical protein ACFYOD_37795 [Streptomyces sp. NPDC006703]|uniref:hypothetical protein n=1 Tax=Streptomyces sp. NPDC006703 TaxID=3364759 RepID=UPI0036C98F7B